MATNYTPTGPKRPKSNRELTEENEALKQQLAALTSAILEGVQDNAAASN